jgi:hypothetical protein
LISLILAVSAVSYFLVEKPLRATNWSAKWIIGLLFLLPSVLVATASLYLIGTDNRLSSTAEKFYAERIQRYTAPASEFSYNCQLSVFNAGVLDRRTCVHGKAGHGKVDALLWGDSHAAHYIGVVGTVAEQAGIRVRNASLSTCPPFDPTGRRLWL